MLTRRAFALFRTLIVASVFVSFWMYFLPRWITGTHAFDGVRPVGWIVVAIGAALTVPCFWEFAWRGLGTPAPFDPPRRLVISGPYRFVRNPMYLSFGVVLIGEAIVFPNITAVMLGLVIALWISVSVFVMVYEEPTLRKMFGSEYGAYCRAVRRWIPRLRPFDSGSGAAVQ